MFKIKSQKEDNEDGRYLVVTRSILRIYNFDLKICDAEIKQYGGHLDRMTYDFKTQEMADRCIEEYIMPKIMMAELSGTFDPGPRKLLLAFFK